LRPISGNAHLSEFDYKLIRQVGSGVTGEVWSADGPAGRVAMRRFVSLSDQGSDDWRAARAHFLQAGRQSLTLRNPRIVSVLDVVDDGKDAWIASDFVEGETLDALLKRERIPAEQASFMLRSIALTLDHAHRSGVPHGDLKPSNIFVGQKRSIRVADFAISPRARRNTDGPNSVTGADSLVHPYLSPEHFIAPASIGAKSDRYSLGAIAYHLYTGKPPFGAGGDAGPAILRGQVAMPSTVKRSLPTGIDSVLMKAMSRDPAQRYSSCVEFIDNLDAVLIPDTPMPAASGSSPKLMYAGLGSLIVALIVVVALMMSGPKKTGGPIAKDLKKEVQVVAPAPPVSPTGQTGRKAGPKILEPGQLVEGPKPKPYGGGGDTGNQRPIVRDPSPPPFKQPQPEPPRRQVVQAPQPPPELPELPRPPGSQPGYSLVVYSRDTAHQIGNGISFDLRDPTLGEMGPGDLMAQVVLVGPPSKGNLSVECNLDGTTMAYRPAKPNSMVTFRDRPSPGTYRIILRQDTKVLQEYTFRIKP